MALKFHYLVPANYFKCDECGRPYIIVNKNDPMGRITENNFGIESTCSHDNLTDDKLKGISNYAITFLTGRKGKLW